MKIKTSELSGAALDRLVVLALGYTIDADNCACKDGVPEFNLDCFNPSEVWAQGGPIIDREDITWSMQMLPGHGDATRFCAFSYRVGSSKAQAGPTKLIAAMRCFVASKLGDEVDVPEELCQ